MSAKRIVREKQYLKLNRVKTRILQKHTAESGREILFCEHIHFPWRNSNLINLVPAGRRENWWGYAPAHSHWEMFLQRR